MIADACQIIPALYKYQGNHKPVNKNININPDFAIEVKQSGILS